MRYQRTVPRFYFHTNLPSERATQDDEGFEFATIHEAKCEAVKSAGQMLSDAKESFWDHGDFELIVTDDEGLVLFAMRVVGIEAPAIRSSRPQP